MSAVELYTRTWCEVCDGRRNVPLATAEKSARRNGDVSESARGYSRERARGVKRKRQSRAWMIDTDRRAHWPGVLLLFTIYARAARAHTQARANREKKKNARAHTHADRHCTHSRVADVRPTARAEDAANVRRTLTHTRTHTHTLACIDGRRWLTSPPPPIAVPLTGNRPTFGVTGPAVKPIKWKSRPTTL